MMRITAYQLGYLPWPGLVDRAARADVFVVLDNVQYERHGFNNRNRIKTAAGAPFLTVPVRSTGHFGITLGDVKIDGQQWKRKHILTVEQAYRKAPYFGDVFDDYKRIVEGAGTSLLMLNVELFAWMLYHLSIDTPIDFASDVAPEGTNWRMILDLCRKYEADEFIFGKLGARYADFDAFREAGVEPLVHEYRTPVYPQLHGPYRSGLSILDLLMNCGPDSRGVVHAGAAADAIV